MLAHYTEESYDSYDNTVNNFCSRIYRRNREIKFNIFLVDRITKKPIKSNIRAFEVNARSIQRESEENITLPALQCDHKAAGEDS